MKIFMKIVKICPKSPRFYGNKEIFNAHLIALLMHSEPGYFTCSLNSGVNNDAATIKETMVKNNAGNIFLL